ncbi:MAG: hypothetical protein ACNS62_23980 [Candidatus Cyclobacteriaceae bacterium M3_2C_046]
MANYRTFNFCLSFRLGTEVHLEYIEGINLSQAKDKLLLNCPEATDIINWTQENKESINNYLKNQTRTRLATV